MRPRRAGPRETRVAETDESLRDLSFVAELAEESEAFLLERPGVCVVALFLCEIGQVADGHREEPDVASRARKLRALGVGDCCSLLVAER